MACLGLFAALAIVHTWPLATSPGHLSRNDNADAVLHEWIIAWVAHQTFVNPLHLFDANIFYPERNTLAYSDHLFVQSMMAAPLLWAGATPVLAHNLVLLAGFVLTGWATSLVLKRWTGSWPAAIVGGSLMAFNSFTLTRLPQIQDLHLEFFPLALLALDRLITAPTTKDAVKLAGWYGLQALTGMYLLVFTGISLAVATLARAGELAGPRLRLFLPRALLAALIVLVAVAPFLLPYYRVSRSPGMSRSLDDTRQYAAVATDYLASAGRMHFRTWSRPFFEGDALFPGVTALVLALFGLATGARRDPRVRMTAAFGVVAFALSFGPAFPPYVWIYNATPILSAIRGSVRFGQLVLAAVAILAAFGLAAAERRLAGRPRAAAALAGVCLCAVHAEIFCAPLGFRPYTGRAPVVQVLQRLPRRAVIAWLPMYPSAQFHANAPAMLASVGTWQPMLNGYSGFKPASYYEHVRHLASFPDAPSISYLKGLGVAYVIVDLHNMRPDQLERLPAVPNLHLWTDDGNVRVYLLTS